MTTQKMSQEQAVKTVYQYAAKLKKEGKTDSQIISQLIQKGMDPNAAKLIVQNIAKAQKAGMKAAGKKNMLFGGLWFLVGAVVTIGSLASAASSGGGSYVVAYGAIIFGAIQFFRGLFQFLK